MAWEDTAPFLAFRSDSLVLGVHVTLVHLANSIRCHGLGLQGGAGSMQALGLHARDGQELFQNQARATIGKAFTQAPTAHDPAKKQPCLTYPVCSWVWLMSPGLNHITLLIPS